MQHFKSAAFPTKKLLNYLACTLTTSTMQMYSWNNDSLSTIASIYYSNFWKHAFYLPRPTDMDTSTRRIYLMEKS